jgi:hypothetical protein
MMYYTIDSKTGMFVVNGEKFTILPVHACKDLIALQKDYDYYSERGEISLYVLIRIKNNLKKICAANGVKIEMKGIFDERIKFVYNNEELILPDPATRKVLFEKTAKLRYVEY